MFLSAASGDSPLLSFVWIKYLNILFDCVQLLNRGDLPGDLLRIGITIDIKNKVYIDNN